MPWNEPGNPEDKNKKDSKDSNSDPKDPWTGKPKSDGPPDLEAMLKDFRKKILQSFGKTNKPSDDKNKPSQSDADSFKFGKLGLGTIGLFILLAWLLWGIVIVGPAEQAVVLRFGKYLTTLGSGPHWIPRFIEEAYPVNEQKISTYSYSAKMLTKDQNIVSVDIAVQYRIGDARAYLFNVVNPDESLRQATASSLRQVIGQTNLDQVLTSGRSLIRQSVQTNLGAILSKYKTGLLITDVAIQPAKAPDEVKEAFDDAIKAQEDEQRFENQAQAYAMQVVPIAKGQAQRLLAEAKGYQQQIVLKAQADIAPFVALLPEYQKAPAVTRQRLYLETLQNIFANNDKVVLDTSASNMLYLPLDKLKTNSNINTNDKTDSSAPSPSVITAGSTATASNTNTSDYGPSDNNPQGGY